MEIVKYALLVDLASRLQASMSNIKLSATKVNSFHCKAIATKSSILDIAGVPDPP